jgi:hypothetical protein
MNAFPRNALALTARLILVMGVGAGALARAAPGAHGPDGEHLDQKATNVARAGPPRIESHSELFELVGALNGGVLTVMIDRYETNEPVLGATLELESGAHKAVASFRAESGDYAVTDPALLKALAVPGEHALVFTLTAGPDVDLLDGTLVVAGNAAGARNLGHDHTGATADHQHDHGLTRTLFVGAGLAGLAVLGVAAWGRMGRGRKRHGAAEVRP